MSDDPRPVPRPVGAVTLTLLAWAVITVAWASLAPSLGHWTGLAVGLALGYGLVGTLAARAVPAPNEVGLGLRGFAPAALPATLLLLPAVLLASELDNVVRPLVPHLPADEPAAIGAPRGELLPYLAIEFTITTVLLRPVLEEFFFRGVVQQGVVAALGAPRGIAFTTLCYALAESGLGLPMGTDVAASQGAQALLLGPLLSALRLATGSLLAPIVASIAMAVAGSLAVAGAEDLPIPGFNAPGDHTPWTWLLPAAASVGAGLLLLRRHAERR